MTAGLANSPADQTPQSVTKKCQHSSPSDCIKAKNKTSFKLLFADPANAPVIDPYADGERRVRAAVSARTDAGSARPQAAQRTPEAAALGSGGATVPQGGNGDHPRLLSSLPFSESNQFKGSSTVSRFALLTKIQKLCKPENEGERGPAVCGCGMPPASVSHVNIHLRYGEQPGEIRAGVSGVLRCDSPWVCPVCATRKALERAEKVQEAADATYNRGGNCALVVLTASHSAKMTLEFVESFIKTASSDARKTRAWHKAKEKYQILGVICGQEVTYSIKNGWHYHQHLSVLVDGPDAFERIAANGNAEKLKDMVAERTQAAGDWLAEAYKEKIRGAGGVVDDEHGCMVRVADDAEDASNYTAKGSMAWEVSGAFKNETKSKKSLTPWDIANLAANGDKFMYARWREYMSVMHGKRSCVRSAALCKKLGIVPDSEEGGDEQIVHEPDDVVGTVVSPLWKRWMRHGLASTFLLRVEYGGEAGFSDAVEQTNADSDLIGTERGEEETVAELLARLDVERDGETTGRLKRIEQEAVKWREAVRREREAARGCQHRFDMTATPENIAEIAGERIRLRADFHGQRTVVAGIVDELAKSYGVQIAEAYALRVANDAPGWMREIEAIMPGRWLSDEEDDALLRMAA
ncbi:hypothetical protein G6K98_00060 [Agrobacterium rhizogenes]|nr:hypothetical protein [Rhizobium rhizogenes]NTH55892.1 hypothetical protein [Rhizobium rhizogenes]NTH87522.1 hypothetical protein [Rhizobium rhizogenes]